jgi:hypothetical protein
MYIGVGFSGRARFFFCSRSYRKIAAGQWNQPACLTIGRLLADSQFNFKQLQLVFVILLCSIFENPSELIDLNYLPQGKGKRTAQKTEKLCDFEVNKFRGKPRIKEQHDSG